MTPIRRMALTLFAPSILMLAAAIYAARPRCTCVLGGEVTEQTPGYDDPSDCAVHGSVTP